jgi:hypothetical protein
MSLKETLHAKTPARLGIYAGLISLIFYLATLVVFKEALAPYIIIEITAPFVILTTMTTLLSTTLAAFILSKKNGGIKSTGWYALAAAVLTTIIASLAFAIITNIVGIGGAAPVGFFGYLIAFAIVKHYNRN